jgi:type IV secretion system protein VirB5
MDTTSSRIKVAGLAFAALVAIGPVAAQVPVEWPKGTLYTIQQLLDNSRQLLNQLTQLDNMDRDYAAVTGDRGMASLLRDSRYDNYAPLDALDQLDSVASQGFAGLSAQARALMPPGLLARCAGVVESQRLACETSIGRPYANASVLRQALTAQSGLRAQINLLTDRISSATDPQAVAQLNARLAALQAALRHESNRVETLKANVENDERISDANSEASTIENLTRTGGLRIRGNPGDF